MDLKTTMAELEKLGTAQTRKTWANHGATGDYFGVKIGDMKSLLKKVRGRQDLALELYDTGNLDAMYFAGLLADGARMSKKQLQRWVSAARSQGISEYTVPWVAAESAYARELALEWIDSPEANTAAAGWNTYAAMISYRPDEELDAMEIAGLLARVGKEIDGAPNRVRYCMNGFVIAAGSCVKGLLAKAKATARRIGAIEVDMGVTACKVPPALATIEKIESMGRIGKKRAAIKC